MTKRLLQFAIAPIMTLTLLACNEAGNSDGNAASTNLSLDSHKISLDDATYEQVAPYVHQCQGHKLCVEICHRPPGNPENSKTMQLPLSATRAHLNHGNASHLKDYLGACDAEGNDDDGGETDDGEIDGGETDDGDTGGTDDTPDNPPTWCEVYYEVDNDCDGYNDTTGESLF